MLLAAILESFILAQVFVSVWMEAPGQMPLLATLPSMELVLDLARMYGLSLDMVNLNQSLLREVQMV